MNYRYPGPQSFTEEDELLFFGRKREIKALYDLIMVQPLVVLFSKSGMGKTSLLQAGIIPHLRFTEYDPVIVRLNDVQTPPELQALRKIAPNAIPGAILWTEITRYNRENNGSPLLIFDQFEEIFTLYSDEQRAGLVRQLADVINGSLPELIRQHIHEGLAAGNLDTSAVAELERTPRVKIIFSIRSDLLHYLHLLSAEIPSILRNRFELLGLRPEQAREAIINPAAQAQEDGDYASPAFGYTEQAVSQILSYLSHRQQSLFTGYRQEPEIESFQLQLLCEYIEKKVTGLSNPTSDKITVTPEFFGEAAGIEAVLANYYENTLLQIADPDTRHLARRLIEDHLIKNQRRVSVDENTIALSHGVSRIVLDGLVGGRLLRRDSRETGDYYELSHDTLLPPIIRSKELWDNAEAERRARAAAELARRETRKRRRAVIVAIVAGALAVLAVLSWLVAFSQYKAAERAKLEIFRNALEAQLSLARMLKVEGKYVEAVGQLDNIIRFATGLDPAARDSIRNTRDNWQRVAQQMIDGENLARTGDLRAALERFEAARQISPDTRIETLSSQTAADLENRFADFYFRAERQFQAGQYQFAVENYKNALKLKPENKEVQQKLQTAEQKFVSPKK